MKNWKVKEGQKLDLAALPDKLRGLASVAYGPCKSVKDISEQHRVANARADIADYFGYVADSRNIPLSKVVHAFKTGRLMTLSPASTAAEASA